MKKILEILYQSKLFKLIENFFLRHPLFLDIFRNLWTYLNLLSYLFWEDFYLLKENLQRYKRFFFSLSLFKWIMFIFLTIIGFFPVYFFVSLIFFFFKYFFRYFYITLDFLYFSSNPNFYYEKSREYFFSFFEFFPEFIKKTYYYFFGGGWLRYFLFKIKSFFRRQWFRFLSWFFRVTDKFLLLWIPKKFNLWREYFSHLYVTSIITFYRSKTKTKNFYKNSRRYFWRIFRNFRRRYRFYFRFFRKHYREIYYFIYFKRIKFYVYRCWIFRKFIWSEVCVVTIEAFSYITFWDFIACVIYIKRLIVSKIEFFFVEIFFFFAKKRVVFFLHREIFFDKCKCHVEDFYHASKKIFLKLILWFVSHLSFFFSVLIYYQQHWWIAYKIETYEIDEGFRSYMWWNVQFYSVIWKYFRIICNPYYWSRFIYDLKTEWILYHGIWYYYFGFLKRRFRQYCAHQSILLWDWWIQSDLYESEYKKNRIKKLKRFVQKYWRKVKYFFVIEHEYPRKVLASGWVQDYDRLREKTRHRIFQRKLQKIWRKFKEIWRKLKEILSKLKF